MVGGKQVDENFIGKQRITWMQRYRINSGLISSGNRVFARGNVSTSRGQRAN